MNVDVIRAIGYGRFVLQQPTGFPCRHIIDNEGGTLAEDACVRDVYFCSCRIDLKIIEHRTQWGKFAREAERMHQFLGSQIKREKVRVPRAMRAVIQRPKPILSVDTDREGGVKAQSPNPAFLKSFIRKGYHLPGNQLGNLHGWFRLRQIREEDSSFRRNRHVTWWEIKLRDRFHFAEREKRVCRAVFQAPAFGKQGRG